MINSLFEHQQTELSYIKNMDLFIVMLVERFIYYRIFKLIEKKVISGNMVYVVQYRGENMEIFMLKDGVVIRKQSDKPLRRGSGVAFSGNEITSTMMKVFLGSLEKARREKIS